ncbi:MAG: response regulator [Blastocatellia bacterium]|nr:response regulator [Blastocatellia bacterium]
MNDQTRIVRVLIVEDDKWQRQGIKDTLDQISPDIKQTFGISSFECEEAGSLTDAMALLKEARDDPHDLVLLDLSLPLHAGDVEESPDNGFRLLDAARKSGAAHEVIVISRFIEYWNVARAFRGGALDFIAKPYTADVLQAHVMKCWKRRLAGDSRRLFERRMQELLPFDGKLLAHEFSGCFSRFIQTVLNEAEEMESELIDWQASDLPRERQAVLLRHLAAMEEAVEQARQEWGALQSSLSNGADASRRCIVEELLEQIGMELMPGLNVKNVWLEFPREQKTPVLSFQDDVRAVLKEVIIGALAGLPDYNKFERLSISVSQVGEYASVRFNGNLFRIDPAVAAKIGRGERQRDENFGQIWGLSVAQYIALRGGGRLQIGSEEAPDSVTYLIPLTRHD